MKKKKKKELNYNFPVITDDILIKVTIILSLRYYGITQEKIA